MIFPEVKIYTPDIYTDFRGDLWTLWHKDKFEPKLDFNHDKVSTSRHNVLRGIHGDNKSWKLITCLTGEIYLVVVDNRPESSNYLKWDSIILTAHNRKKVLAHVGREMGFNEIASMWKMITMFKYALKKK